MNKQIFLKTYRDEINPKIRVYFSDDEFLQNTDILINQEAVDVVALKSFYVARYSKSGKVDNRKIEHKILDRSTSLVRLATAVQDPAYWGLAMQGRPAPSLSDLWAIPVATSTCGKTLVLDSNHTALSIVKSADYSAHIPIIRISGTNMEELIIDFKLLNRQTG